MKKSILFLPLLLLTLQAGIAAAASSDAKAESPVEKAEVKNHRIVVGAYTSQKYAERQKKRLGDVLDSDEEIAALREEIGFEYAIAASGSYFVVSIDPIRGDDALKRLLEAARKLYPDAYVKISKKKSLLPKEAPKPVEPAPAIVETQAEAPIVAVADAKPIVPEPVENTQPGSDTEPLEKPQPVAAPAPAPAGLDLASPDMMLYGGVGVAVLLLLLSVLMRRKREKKPATEEKGVCKAPVAKPTEAEEAAVEPVAIEEEAVVPAPVEEIPAPAEEAVEVEEAAVEPVAIEEEAVSEALEEEFAVVPEAVVEEPKEAVEAAVAEKTRRKREPRADRGKIVKDSFSEFSGERLLIAEDNLINQKVISKILADSGIEVIIANDGQEALDILAKDSDFRLILMDAHMPNVDGFEATRAIRANPDYDHIAVSALSGDVAADDIRKMQEAGMEAQLEKPLRMEALYDVLYSYFDLKEEAEPEEAQEEAEPAIEGTQELNTEDGLDISGGDEELYREILNEFAETYGNSDQVINAHLIKDEYDAANALLLDIRGIAANIGAGKLSDVAEKLREALLENDEREYLSLTESYKEHLQALLKDIENIK